MKNKNLLILGGVALVIIVAGYLWLNRSSNNDSPQVADDSQVVQQEANIVMSAFEGSGSVMCAYKQENVQATVYIKNGMVRMDSIGDGESSSGNVIIKDDTLWAWETGSTEGLTIENISQYESDPNMASEYAVNEEYISEQIEENKANCSEQNIADGIFEIPSEVVFQDFSSNLEDIQEQLPEGYELPEGYQIPSN